MNQNNFKNFWRKSFRFLASIQLAVIIISIITILIAWGTIVESNYDATAAQKLVYRSVWMYMAMSLLATSLIAVIISRWPWKPRHSAFISAHIGILMIMLGQYLTGTYGLDGTLRVEIGQSNNFVNASPTDITVYSSFDGQNYTTLYQQEVDFFLNPPQKKPYSLKLDENLEFVESQNYVIPQKEVVESSNQSSGSGIRFQVHNPNVDVVEWLVQRKPGGLVSHDFGPAQIHLGLAPEKGRLKNEMFLDPQGDHLKYVVFNQRQEAPVKKGTIKEGELIQTGWMNLEFRLLRYLKSAEEKWNITPKERPTPLTTPAVKFRYKGRETWLLLNDTVKLFSDNAVYFVSYGNRRIDMGFPLKLKSFTVDRYQGTMRAAAYKSVVEVAGKEHVISMNEPLKHNDLTIYQASFQEGPGGTPVASIFSVNYDPGRWLKYLGSLVMSIGIILLFYFRKRAAKKPTREVSP